MIELQVWLSWMLLLLVCLIQYLNVAFQFKIWFFFWLDIFFFCRKAYCFFHIKLLICHFGLAAGTVKGRLNAYILTVNIGEVILDAREESLICCTSEVIIVSIAWRDFILYLQDVVNQILSFSKFGPQAICTILSATGIVSSVTISQPSHPGELESFEAWSQMDLILCLLFLNLFVMAV